MASPNAVFTELVTTTFRKHAKEIKDNVSKNNALYARIMDKGTPRKEDGGLTIVAPLDYAANGTYQRYSGYDVLNVSASDVLSAAEFQWRQIAMNVVASGLELRTNSGGTRILNLVKSRMKNAMRTFKNNFSADIYSDGTLPNQINGLQALVSDAGTGTVGGIDSSVWGFWRSQVQSAAAPLQGGAAIVPGPTTMESLMLPLWLSLIRGDDKPDLIVADNNYFSYYEQSQTSIKRYTNDGNGAGKASGGFTSLKYKTADVIFDGGSGIPLNHMYFLNTEYLDMVVHTDADLVVMDEMRPYNQDAAVVPILWMGNMVISNRNLQGLIKP
ncbi:major virion structural protein [Bacteriophage sp.]|nr:major virion structural protein [Bacteriophage sp.]